jgi:methylated-DNA-[protein]-cysteine S-methyltransferase
MTALHHTTVPTPIGALTIVCTDAGVVATILDDDERDPEMERIARALAGAPADTAGLDAARDRARTARREVAAYLRGGRRPFSVPADLRMVPDGFKRRVLAVVATIPYGELWTYGDVAAMAGNPRAARAAGSALAACPIELFVPCHRVVHAGGTIGGYGRHEDRKRWLLRHERAIP